MTALHAAILRGAALLVPSPLRSEWLAEWRAELWHVKRRSTLFCLGSFRDAFWLRRNSPCPNIGHTFGLESPVRCGLFLAGLAALSLFLAFRLPLPRDTLLASPYRDVRNLVTIAAAGKFKTQAPTVPFEQYRALASNMPPRFTGLAFYRPARARLRTADLSIAVASTNLFRLLEVPIPAAAPNSLVLSHDAWRKYFGGDAHIVGRAVQVGGLPAVVAGVLPANAWRLPGQVDAWLLEDNLQLSARALGFVVGHIVPSSPQREPDLRWRFDVGSEQEGYRHFECTSLAQPPFATAYLMMCLVSVLLLWTFTPLSLGEYPSNHRSAAAGLRRWAFLSVKIALVLPAAFFGSLDVASFVAPGLQPHALIIGLIAGLRWAVLDQRRRCPVCLRLLTNPIRIGGPAQIFLDWYGTELMCAHGHGMLYVPEIVTSCYGTPRWQSLDPSWSSLFS